MAKNERRGPNPKPKHALGDWGPEDEPDGAAATSQVRHEGLQTISLVQVAFSPMESESSREPLQSVPLA